MNEYLVPNILFEFQNAVVEEESFRIYSIDKNLKLCSLFENTVWYFSSGFQSNIEFVWVFVSFVNLCEFAGWEMSLNSWAFSVLVTVLFYWIFLQLFIFFYILWSVIHCQKYNCKIILHWQKNPANVNIVPFCYPLAVCC